MTKDNINLFLFKLFIITYIFIDFIRRFYDGNKFLLLSLDIIIVLSIFYFIKQHNYKIKYLYRIPILLRIILSLFFFIVFFQILNPWYFDLITYIVGFRSYILAIPIILFGYHFAKYKLLLNQKMIHFIVFLVVLTLVYAIFQVMTDYTKLVGTAMSFITPMEHSVHSYGDQAIQLTSSFFASSKRYGHFLIVMYLLYIGIIYKLKNKVNFFIIILFFISLIISGARESFILFIVVNFILAIKFMKFKSWVYVILFGILFGYVFYIYISDELLLKLEFLLSSPDEYVKRLYMFVPFIFLDFSNPNIFFGLGVGKYGQESLMNINIVNLTDGIDRVFFHKLEFFSNVYGFMDSGFAKISIELGFIGVCIYLCFIVYIFYLSIKQIMKKKYVDTLDLTLSIFILLWIVYMMKAHPVISDIFMSYFLYFSLGYISYNERTIEYN